MNTRASAEHTPPTPNRRGRHARRRLFAAPLAVLALLCVAGLAGSAIAASAAPPTPIAPPTTMMFGNQLTGVACPSTSQCTAVDIAGQQVTFDPVSPGSPTPTTIDANTYLWSVACPTTSQCTAVDIYESGHEVTFDPSSPGSPTPTTNNGGVGMYSVACPSASQCTAVDNAGHEVTFDPVSPGSPTATTIDGSNNLDSVACPSTSQCTAVDGGQEVTFDPTSPGEPTATTIDTISGLDAVACPSANQCTAVDRGGNEVTFNPTSVPAPVPAPVLGKSVDVAPVSGVVLLRQPGRKRFTRLLAGERIPVGSTIDTTAGVVSLTAALNAKGKTTTGRFYAGQFRLAQKRARTAELTVLTLTGPRPTGCAVGVASAARKKPRRRSLWSSGSGGFRTVGTDASATELGTKWLTEDTCAGTLIRVTQGAVTLDDLPHHRSFVLRAPHSFLAHRGKGG